MNGAVNTDMGAQRAKNGHPAPYHVKLWNIGNEPWGSWQLGRTDLKYFVFKHNEFAKAMRAVDPSITLIASGLMLEDWYLTGETRAKYAGNLGPLYGGDFDWTGGFLKTAGVTSTASPSTGTHSRAATGHGESAEAFRSMRPPTTGT